MRLFILATLATLLLLSSAFAQDNEKIDWDEDCPNCLITFSSNLNLILTNDIREIDKATRLISSEESRKVLEGLLNMLAYMDSDVFRDKARSIYTVMVDDNMIVEGPYYREYSNGQKETEYVHTKRMGNILCRKKIRFNSSTTFNVYSCMVIKSKDENKNKELIINNKRCNSMESCERIMDSFLIDHKFNLWEQEK